MKSIFTILEECDVKYELNLKQFIEKDFAFIHKIDPKYLDQMTADEICDTDNFFNEKMSLPFTFLIQNKKVNKRGFDCIMSKDAWHVTYSFKQNFYSECFKYIIENEIDVVADYFKNKHISNVMGKMIYDYKYFNISEIIKFVDIDSAIKKESFIVLLFSLQDETDKHFKTAHYKFLKDNYEKLLPHYFTESTVWKINSISHYYKDNHHENVLNREFLVDFINSSYTNEELIKLGNEVFIEAKINDYLKYNEYKQCYEFLLMVKDNHSKIYEEYSEYELIRKYINNYIDDFDLNSITQDKFSLLMNNCNPSKKSEIFNNIDLHKKLNENGLFFNFYDDIQFNLFNKEVVEFYINKISDLPLDSKDRKDYRFNSTVTWLFQIIISLSNTNDWAIELFAVMFFKKEFKQMIIDYIQVNGDLRLLNIVANISPSSIKNDFDHEKLVMHIVHYGKVKDEWW